MTCIARTIFTTSLQAHQDVGLRTRRLRRLGYADAATQAQGTAPVLLVDDRLLFCFDSLSCSAFGRSRFVSSVRDLTLSILLSRASIFLFCLSVPLLSLVRSIQSFVLLLSSNHLTRYAFPVNSPSLVSIVPVYLIDKDILAFP